ncbi:hypothetical protein BOTBODRAFT_180789 [Botryobasidium botryosum FD-172 SS1]|uniref:Uncharacterized protein n=1 Tax=Botryobasidium botryosum (strain FD-172 SS1) TaxID=930990 RepID=A0A067M699_BOTB1|nr:hypothetical protein BOTBODRAFT_180789 [Botryobasidium botryosum FD-172 SS1]
MDWPQYHILDSLVVPPASVLGLTVSSYVSTRFEVLLGAEPLPRFTHSYPGLQNIFTVKHLLIRLDNANECYVEGYTSEGSECRPFFFNMRMGHRAFAYALATLYPCFPMPLESLALSNLLSPGEPPEGVDPAALVSFLRRNPLTRKLEFESFPASAIQVLKITLTRHLCPRLVNCMLPTAPWISVN